jgi:hypothetical protein
MVGWLVDSELDRKKGKQSWHNLKYYSIIGLKELRKPWKISARVVGIQV